MSGSNHPSLVKIPDMALPHVFVPCVDILLKNHTLVAQTLHRNKLRRLRPESDFI